MRSLLPALALACLLVVPAAARDWPQWRGPFFNGTSDEKNLPTHFSPSENIAWKAELPGVSAATPSVCGPRVYLSAVDESREMLLALGFERATGKLLWKQDISTGLKRDARSNFASPSPAADGQRVVFFYASGDLVCFDPYGRPLWRRNIQKDYGEFAYQWTFGSSPLLFDGKLYLEVLQRDVPVHGHGLTDRPNESYLLAMDPATGKTLWRVIRPSRAEAESKEAYSTPIPYEEHGKTVLLITGGDALTAHDPATGKELWRWETWNPQRIGHWRLVPSPIAGAGIVLACAPKRDPIYAIRTGGAGMLTDQAVAWVSREVKELTSDVPTPAFYDGDFFVLSDLRKSLARVDPQTGKVKWSITTPGGAKYEASPLAADGKLYIVNFLGQVSVIGADNGQVLHTVSMDQPPGNEVVRSSIVAAGGQLFLRTTRTLYCVGAGK